MRGKFNAAPLVVWMGLTLLLAPVVIVAGWSVMQNVPKKPISKTGLLEAIKLNGLSTSELIERVEQRGVAFQLTSADEAEFRAAGARPELIEAVRANYRETARTPATTTSRANTPSGAPVPAGAPLSKAEIVTLLQSGVPPARVEQFVEARGVTFAVTPDVTREIIAAGGNRSLLGAITEKSTGSTTGNRVSNQPALINKGPDYDDLVEQATGAILAGNSPLAVRYSQQAIQLDPSQAAAYQLLGYAQLYGYRDARSAETSMRAALERGGSGVFRVYHDHDGFFKQYCQGSMFVTKSGVTFKADDGNDTFEAADEHIKEVKINAFVGSEYGAFHIKVTRPGDKSRNYNFAPWMNKQVESNLIINLIKSY